MKHYHFNQTNNIHLEENGEQKNFVVMTSVATSAIVVGALGGTAGTALTGGALVASYAIGAVVAAGVYTGLYFGGKALMDSMTPESPDYDPSGEVSQLEQDAAASEENASNRAKELARMRMSRINKYGERFSTGEDYVGDTSEASIYKPTLLGGAI